MDVILDKVEQHLVLVRYEVMLQIVVQVIRVCRPTMLVNTHHVLIHEVVQPLDSQVKKFRDDRVVSNHIEINNKNLAHLQPF